MDSMSSTERRLESDGRTADQDLAWVAASQGGDSAAFNRLVLKWERRIYNLSVRMLQDPEEAEEATQEIFLAAFRNIRRFRRDSRFSTWIYRIAVNKCISRIRRRPPGVHYSLDDRESDLPPHERTLSRESHEEEVMRAESRRRVRGAMEHLSSEQRAVVELKFFQEMTFDEISTALETPLSTIKSRLYAGLEILKTRLGRTRPEA